MQTVFLDDLMAAPPKALSHLGLVGTEIEINLNAEVPGRRAACSVASWSRSARRHSPEALGHRVLSSQSCERRGGGFKPGCRSHAGQSPYWYLDK